MSSSSSESSNRLAQKAKQAITSNTAMASLQEPFASKLVAFSPVLCGHGLFWCAISVFCAVPDTCDRVLLLVTLVLCFFRCSQSHLGLFVKSCSRGGLEKRRNLRKVHLSKLSKVRRSRTCFSKIWKTTPKPEESKPLQRESKRELCLKWSEKRLWHKWRLSRCWHYRMKIRPIRLIDPRYKEQEQHARQQIQSVIVQGFKTQKMRDSWSKKGTGGHEG